ncbi:MAG: thioredoxin domain-containing protein [Alphaproteobacteria bacterium]|nr:thioredoxin domain-containing protein [Alphaproteobacteria bacterium]
MVWVLRLVAFAVALITVPWIAKANPLVEHTLGSPTAPVKVDEYMSVTCSHCADFYLKILPELQKRYIDTGKVRFVVHDFPLNSLSLKAAAVSQCMPKEQYFAFIKTLYSSLLDGTLGFDIENRIYQYAALGGLPVEKAKECANNKKIHEEIARDVADAGKKYDIDATPTFAINDGAAIIRGAQSLDVFASEFDKALGVKKEKTDEKKK